MNKVDRALERRVIDWLQWSEFPEDIGKRPDDSDMAQLTLELIGKRKSAYKDLEQKLAIATEALDFYTKHPDYWPVDENGKKLDEGASHVAKVALTKITDRDNGK
jgi:hypothetical protein